MATFTPPSRIPTWATDGGADVVDPGASKQADGFLVGEAPAAGHMNWTLNQMGDLLQFHQDTLAPYIGHMNKKYSSATPFGTDTMNRWIGKYLPAMDRYYVVCHDNVSDDIIAYDSADGVTWSTGKVLDTSGVVFSGMVDDGTDIFVIADGVMYRSTTGLVTNLASYDTLPSQLGTGSNLVYDKVNSKFIYTDASYDLQYSADGLTWTVGTGGTAPTGSLKIAHNPNTGFTLVLESATSDFHYSSDGGVNWSEYVSGHNFKHILYSDAAGGFIGALSTSDELYISDGDTVAEAWEDFDIECNSVVNTPHCLYIYNSTGTLQPTGWYAVKNRTELSERAGAAIAYLGPALAEAEPQAGSEFEDGSYFDGGVEPGKDGGTFFYLYSVDQTLCYSHYGPKKT